MESRNILHGILLLPDISKNLPVAGPTGYEIAV